MTPAGAGVRVLLDGAPVEVRGLPSGLLVPADGRGRTLVVSAAPGVALAVRRIEDRGATAAWDRWERRAVHAGAGPPPTGGERLRAAVELRRLAGASRPVLRLGVLHDTALERPLLEPVYVADPDAEVVVTVPVEREVRGPAVARIGVRPTALDGALVRLSVTAEVDGVVAADAPRVSTGAAPTTLRVWIPPGRHTLAIETGGVPGEATVEVRRVRGRFGVPIGTRDASPVDAAESAFLARDPGAVATWRAWVDAPGALGDLARARVVRLSSDAAEVASLASVAQATPEGAEALVDAVLARAELLDPERVRDLVLAARDPDPVAVAWWLDGPVPGTRAAGVALLERGPDVPAGRSTRIDAVRLRGVATLGRRLLPEAGEGTSTFGPGAGIPRAIVRAGVVAEIVVPARPDGRAPVVRLQAPGPVAYAVDGEARRSPGGRLDLAMAPGTHHLSVSEGAIVLGDPELAPGAEPIAEYVATPLPATFGLPDAGVRAPLVVDLDPPASGLAVFDDGHVVAWGATDRVLLDAGALATRLALSADARAAVTLRGRLPPEARPDPLPAFALDEALARIADATRRLDGGDAAARVERVRLLGAVGAVGTARRDLAALDDPEQAATVGRALTASIPARTVPGPVTAEAVLAEHGLDVDLAGLVPAERAARLEAIPDAPTAVLAAAADARLEADDPVRATAAALASGQADVLDRAMLALDRQFLPRADRSGGLVPIEVRPDPPPETLSERVRSALLASPWPASEALVVRGNASDVVAAEGPLRVALFCRDETLLGRPCALPVRVDGVRREHSVPDGTVGIVEVPGSGRREVEVGGPGTGAAVVVRVEADGALLPPQSRRLALRVAPGAPVVLRVAGAAVLQVEVVAGRVSATASGASGAAAAGETVLLPVVAPEAVDLRVEGDGVVLLYRGTPWGAPSEPPFAPAPEETPTAPAWVEQVLDHVPLPSALAPVTMGRVGTLRAGLVGLHDVREADDTAWDAVGIEAGWMRARGSGYGLVEALVDGPAVAAGLAGELGRRWETGRASIGASAATSMVPAPAGHAGIDAEVVQDEALGSGVRARGRIGAFGALYTADPGVAVDPRAWSAFAADHPFGVRAALSGLATPSRNLRLEAGGRATTNAGPSLDRTGPFAQADLLLASATRFGLAGQLQWRFADADRVDAYLRPSVDVSVDHARWVGTRRVTVGALLTALPAVPAVEGRLEVTLAETFGRGLRDLPPDEEPFRALQEAR